MIKKVVFDFDNTLFDTEAVKFFFRRVAMELGYSEAEAKIFYHEARTDGNIMAITFDAYVEVVKKHLQRDKKDFFPAVVESIFKKMKKEGHLLSGALELVEFCRTEGLQSYIVSLGLESWQREKFKLSGLESYFEPSHVVYSAQIEDGKTNSLKSLFGAGFDGSETALFNDKPDETAQLLRDFPQLKAFVRQEPRDQRYKQTSFNQLMVSFPGRVKCSRELAVLKELLEIEFYGKKRERRVS